MTFSYGEKNVAQHDERLEKFLNRVRQVGLKLNRKKSTISASQVEYVGHLLTSEGLKPSPSRVEALENMDTPQIEKNCRRS